jgi:hypothetical protein
MEDQGHSIAGRQPNELFVARIAHLRRPERNLSELVQPLLLLLVQELRVTDDVDEQDMPDLQAQIVVGFRHGLSLPESIWCGDVFLRRAAATGTKVEPQSRRLPGGSSGRLDVYF